MIRLMINANISAVLRVTGCGVRVENQTNLTSAMLSIRIPHSEFKNRCLLALET
jgi:hypothetical protein